MPQPKESLTFYGDKAELFREIADDFEEEMGWEPGNAELGAWLMSKYHQNER
ncbi:hypothetical protein [Halobacterium wangiae]|uniref:hypothetical protein n=1 Tax=Halobacterium wangiae TaxID=2902623 RepID=UPI001E319A16|nr:hypothetical protein [Halobacterium wangiae]